MIEFFVAAAFAVTAMIGLHDDQQELVVLLADEDGKVGVVAVNPGAKQLILDQPLQGATVTGEGQAKTIRLKQSDIDSSFGKALSAMPTAPRSFTLYFRSGTTDLAAGSDAVLPQVIEEIASRASAEVLIIGHTDTMGALSVNDRLSRKRAESVLDWLVGQGLKRDDMRPSGRGERELLVKTPDNTANRKNRRVEVVVQ